MFTAVAMKVCSVVDCVTSTIVLVDWSTWLVCMGEPSRSGLVHIFTSSWAGTPGPPNIVKA